jgi:hypothetical protein
MQTHSHSPVGRRAHTRALRPTFLSAALTGLVMLLAACGESEVTAYRVAKETAPAPEAADGVAAHANLPVAAAPATAAPANAPAMADTAVATASGPGLTWTAPAHWTAKPPSSMRKGSYTVEGGGGAADLSITAFPGDVGGETANVNRWRGQLQLTALPDAEANGAILRLEAGGIHIGFVEVANSAGGTPARMLGAMVPYQGATWFFKLVGPEPTVAKEKDAFVAFLKTIKPASAATSAP